MAVLKNVENKIKMVMIISSLFLMGCIVISLGSIIIARGMVSDAHKKYMCWMEMYQCWLDKHPWKKPLKWKPRVILRCSIIYSLRSLLTISTFDTPWRKPCISLTKQAWHNIMRSRKRDSTIISLVLPPSAVFSVTASNSTRTHFHSPTMAGRE